MSGKRGLWAAGAGRRRGAALRPDMVVVGSEDRHLYAHGKGRPRAQPGPREPESPRGKAFLEDL